MSGFTFQELGEKWGAPIVSRTQIERFTGGLLNQRTLANLDSIGAGPKGRIRVGRKIAYPVQSVIEFLESRAQRVA